PLTHSSVTEFPPFALCLLPLAFCLLLLIALLALLLRRLDLARARGGRGRRRRFVVRRDVRRRRLRLLRAGLGGRRRGQSLAGRRRQRHLFEFRLSDGGGRGGLVGVALRRGGHQVCALLRHLALALQV